MRKPRALCPAAWVALVHVLPVPPQSHWLNSSAVTPPAHSWDFWRGVWRCLAQSQGVESTGIIGKEKPDPPQAAAKETSSVLTLSPSICTPNHVISTVPFIPKGSLVGGKTQELSPSAAASGWRSRGEGAPSPSLLLGREDILASLAPGSACWASCCCWSHPTMTSQLSHHCLNMSPSPSPLRHPTSPPAVSSLPATLLLPGLSRGKGCRSVCFGNVFLN